MQLLRRFPDVALITDQIRTLWVEILGVNAIDPTSHFFEMGGHLALATRLTSALHEKLNSDTTLRDVIENPVFQDMVKVVAKRQRASHGKDAMPAAEYRVSHEQEALWTIDRMREGYSCEYQNGYSVEFDHLASPELVSNAINALLERHKVLRSVFEGRGDGVYGKVLSLPVSLKPEKVEPGNLRGIIEDEVSRPFHLGEAPPIRFRLFHTGPDRSLLFVSYHQILHDEHSAAIIKRELKQIYNGFGSGVPVTLPPVSFSYANYSELQRQRDFSSELAYWLTQLNGYEPTCLGLEGEWKPRTSHTGGRHRLEMNKCELANLGGLRDATGSSDFAILLAAFYVALSRYTGVLDLAIGSLVSRREPHLPVNSVGTFLNPVVLRSKLDEGKSLEDFLAQDVMPAVTGALKCRQVPLKVLADAMTKTWGGHSQSLFNMAFSYHALPGGGEEELALHEGDKGVCKFDLSCDVFDSGDTLHFVFEYSTELYKPELIAEFAGRYRSLLLLLTAGPEKPIKDVYDRPVLDAAASNRWHEVEGLSWNECFRETAAKSPDAIAITYGSVSLSYGELDLRSTQLALAIRERIELHHKDRDSVVVGVLFERSPEMLITMIAILKAGCAYLPMNYGDPVGRRRILLEDSTAALVVMSDNLPKMEHPACTEHLSFSALAQARPRQLAGAGRKALATDLAYVIYTSGTTGKPKGVMIEHQQLVNYQAWFGETVDIGAIDRVDFSTNLVFDASLTTTLVSLGLGKCVSICPDDVKRDPRKFLEYIQAANVNLMKTTPSYFNQLIPYADRIGPLPHLKLVLTTGEEMSPVDSRKWLRHFPHHVLLNSYGPTEATVTVSKYQVSSHNCDAFSTRTPIEQSSRWCQFHVLDERLRPVPTGVEGELYIAGPILCRGYLNNPEENRRKFINLELATGEIVRAYQTGDRCIRFAGGDFCLRGRKDSQFKMRGGFRVELEEINSVIRSHPLIVNSVVVAHNDERFSHLIAYITVHDSVSGQASNFVEVLRQHLLQQMPSYMVPPHIVCVDEIKLTPSGKVDVKAMGAYAPSSRAALGPFQASGPLEVTMLQIWRQVLKQDRVSVDSNFFHLGGNSLLAMELVTRIRDTFDTDLNFNMVFSNPTIRSLAKVLRGSCENSHFIRFSRGEGKPTLFLIHPATGLAGLYSGISNAIEGVNIYGISNDRFGNSVNPYETLEQMAAQYAEQIAKAHPGGELYVGGFCCGGAVAFEVARIFHSKGRPVAGLCLIDSFKLQSHGSKEEEDRYHALVLAARGLEPGSFFGKKLLFELEHNRKLVMEYQPAPLPIKTLLLKSNDIDDYGVDPEHVRRLADEDNGWKAFLRPDMKEVFTIAASHSSLFREDGMPQQLGQYVQRFVLSQAKGQGQASR